MQFRPKETIENGIAAATTRKSIRAAYAAAAQLLNGLILVTVGGVGIGDITLNQWLVIAAAVMGSAGVIYGITTNPE